MFEADFFAVLFQKLSLLMVKWTHSKCTIRQVLYESVLLPPLKLLPLNCSTVNAVSFPIHPKQPTVYLLLLGIKLVFPRISYAQNHVVFSRVCLISFSIMFLRCTRIVESICSMFFFFFFNCWVVFHCILTMCYTPNNICLLLGIWATSSYWAFWLKLLWIL